MLSKEKEIKQKTMDEISKILGLMKRMRLFSETDGYNLTDKFIIENIKKDLLEEGIHQSYDAKDIYKILLKHYNIGNEENFLENNNDIGIYYDGSYNSDGILYNNEINVLILVIPNNFSDTEKIKSFITTCGWILAQEKEYYKNKNYTAYTFHKNKQVKNIELPEVLYHLTPETKLNKILKNGLVPRTSNILSNRPERIYLYTEKMWINSLRMFANALWKAQLEKKLNLSGLAKQEIAEKLNEPRNIKYVLLEIDTSKCENLKVYGDPDMDGAVWTYDNVPPQAIKIINDNI